MVKKLIQNPEEDLEDFIRKMNRDSWFALEYNNPPVQEIINNLIFKDGSCIRPTENYKLRELTDQIAKVFNAVDSDKQYFAEPILNWKRIEEWVNIFGCPPIKFSDGYKTNLFNIQIKQNWHEYLSKIISILD